MTAREKTPAKRESLLAYEPISGKVCCYGCGQFYQATPCSVPMLNAILRQWKREHQKCPLSPRGDALLKEISEARRKAIEEKPELANSMGILGPPKSGMTIGQKIAHHIEVEIMKRALNGEEIPFELAENKKFMASVEALRKAGVSIEDRKKEDTPCPT